MLVTSRFFSHSWIQQRGYQGDLWAAADQVFSHCGSKIRYVTQECNAMKYSNFITFRLFHWELGAFNSIL